MKAIIVPTDFSGNALYAAYYAADFAALIGARVHLLHVYTLPVPLSETPIIYDAAQVEADATRQLNIIKEKLLTRVGGRINIDIAVRSDEVIPGIIEYSNSIQPYAVIMGAEGTGPVERFLFGGKTLSAVKKLSWPLIVVPPFITFKNIRKIGLACDFREVVESVRTKEIKEIVKEFDAELHILYITDEIGDSFKHETVEESGLLQEMLGELKPKYHFLNATGIETGINDFAEKNKLDLLIIVPKKHNLGEKIFSQSHSKRLVLNAHVPIMSLHE
jgi:nucleotide-binding universal stress UspA family protein